MGMDPASTIASGSGYASLRNSTYNPQPSAPPSASYNFPPSTLADPTYNPNPSGGPAGPYGYMTLAGVGTQQGYNAGVENNYALALNQMTAPELASYTQYLNQMTSADPTQRMAAVAPAAQSVAQQQEQARKNIANLPRGGANSYLTGESYIQESSDIGSLINQAYTQAQQQKGQLGEFGVQATESGFNVANAALSESAGTIGQAVGLKQNQQAANQAMGIGAAGTIANLIGML